MTDSVVLKDLLEFTRDGEWGKGAATSGHVEMAVIRGTDFAAVRSGDMSSVPRRFIAAKAAERKMLEPGDLLIETAGGTKDQPTGRTVLLNRRIFEASDLPITCASFSRFLRVKRDLIDPRYLFWYLQSIYTTGEMLPYHIQHTGVARFQYTDFAAKWHVPIPEMSRQQEIADTLSTIDDKIELNRQMNETLGAIAQAIFRDWFVDFGPTRRKMEGATDAVAILGGLIPNPEKAAKFAALFPANFSADGAPDGWIEKNVGDIVDRLKPEKRYTKKQVLKQGKVPVFEQGAGLFLGFHNDDAGFKATPKEPLMVFGDHTCILHLACCDFDISSNVIPLSGKELSTSWVYHALHGKQEFQEYRRHWSEFVVKKATVPNSNLDVQFAALVQPLLALIETLRNENRTLGESRDLLLPKLMSGEIRLRNAETVA